MAIILNKKLKITNELKNIEILDKPRKNKSLVRIGVLNLMPNLEETERQLIKMLDNPLIDIKLDFIYLDSKSNKEYVKEYYVPFKSIKELYYNGFIITGAPLEHLDYDDIFYIEELKEFLKYTKKHVKSSLFLCWASEFGLKYFYDIDRYKLNEKASGIYEHYIINSSNLIKGFDDFFSVPISRYYSIIDSDIINNKDLILVSKSNDTGAYIIESTDSKQIFVTGHLEYEQDTLENEYLRDLMHGLDIKCPVNYYEDNLIENRPRFKWRAHATLFYHNWLYYYVC